MKFQVVRTKVGYIVQNIQTMSVVNIYKTEAQARYAASKLNK